jgi:hypothetical protein
MATGTESLLSTLSAESPSELYAQVSSLGDTRIPAALQEGQSDCPISVQKKPPSFALP